MGTKSRITKTSLVSAFLAAAGGAATQAQGAAYLDPAVAVAVVSSYFGPLDLEDNFEVYFKYQTEQTSFYKYYKENTGLAIDLVVKFSDKYDIPPPPGFGDED